MPLSAYISRIRSKIGHEQLLVPTVTCIVRDEAGRILLMRHADLGVWTTPGGTVEPGERPADAAVRECFEETGLLVEPVELIGVFGGPAFAGRYHNGDEVAFVMTVFACERRSGTLRPDGVEALDARYVDDVDAIDVPRWLPEVVSHVRAGGSGRFEPATWTPGAQT